MVLRFYKYQGAGNDFIIVDNRDNSFITSTELIKSLCDRRFGVGADGLMTLTADPVHDFSMRYYNSDGRESTMCGNGGRCMAAFALKLGLCKSSTHFSAIDGVHEAKLLRADYVVLKMQDVDGLLKCGKGYSLNTGSPHYVEFVDDVQKVDVLNAGRIIRYHELFGSEGTNVNFVQVTGPGKISMRTYERGVENETLACGTGSVASAITTAVIFQTDKTSFDILAPGGNLKVHFDRPAEESFRNIWLEGPATFVFDGTIKI
jgi:diaminopimelate epimerase